MYQNRNMVVKDKVILWQCESICRYHFIFIFKCGVSSNFCVVYVVSIDNKHKQCNYNLKNMDNINFTWSTLYHWVISDLNVKTCYDCATLYYIKSHIVVYFSVNMCMWIYTYKIYKNFKCIPVYELFCILLLAGMHDSETY